MQRRHMIRSVFCVGATLASILSLPIAGAKPGADEVVLFRAVINSAQVTHHLFQPGDKDIPHPFYKSECAKSAPEKYENLKGSALFSYNKKTNILKYTISYQGLSGSPIMAHFHIAEAGKSGPIVQSICGMPPKNTKGLGSSAPALDGFVCPGGQSGLWWAGYKLDGNKGLKLSTEAERRALFSGKLYVNIHTCLNELGEGRGQILPYAAKR